MRIARPHSIPVLIGVRGLCRALTPPNHHRGSRAGSGPGTGVLLVEGRVDGGAGGVEDRSGDRGVGGEEQTERRREEDGSGGEEGGRRVGCGDAVGERMSFSGLWGRMVRVSAEGSVGWNRGCRVMRVSRDALTRSVARRPTGIGARRVLRGHRRCAQIVVRASLACHQQVRRGTRAEGGLAYPGKPHRPRCRNPGNRILESFADRPGARARRRGGAGVASARSLGEQPSLGSHATPECVGDQGGVVVARGVVQSSASLSGRRRGPSTPARGGCRLARSSACRRYGAGRGSAAAVARRA